MTTNITYTPGHYSSTERVFSQLPALFNDDWLNTVVTDWEKAFDVKNAVYPYNIKAIKNAEGGAEQYTVEVALAGVGKNNIDVKVRKGHLTIDITKEDKEENPNVSYVKKGISKRKGNLSFVLNENIDAKNIKSTYVDGLLRVTIPVQQPEVYNIDIKVD
jgi:HSP20 family molecular chaperone IbpA